MKITVPKILAQILTSALLLLTASAANATCTKPVGTYVGSGSGLAYYTGSGEFYQAASISLSVKILSTGAVSATESGNLMSSGLYNQSWTVPAASNIFNSTTCMGTITNSLGLRYIFTSSGSGNVITFTYATNNGIIVLYNLRLEKV